jgi:hypothetical protein
MFRATSEIAVAMSVRSVAVNPAAAASSLPLRRATTTSPSSLTRTRAMSGPRTVGPGARSRLRCWELSRAVTGYPAGRRRSVGGALPSTATLLCTELPSGENPADPEGSPGAGSDRQSIGVSQRYKHHGLLRVTPSGGYRLRAIRAARKRQDVRRRNCPVFDEASDRSCSLWTGQTSPSGGRAVAGADSPGGTPPAWRFLATFRVENRRRGGDRNVTSVGKSLPAERKS